MYLTVSPVLLILVYGKKYKLKSNAQQHAVFLPMNINLNTDRIQYVYGMTD